MFAEPSWLQVMHGQRIRPRGYHPLVDLHSEQKVAEFLGSVHGVIARCVEVVPDHDAFIARNCAMA